MFLHTFTPSPILFELGPFQVHWYGLLVALGIAAGYFVAHKLWVKSGRQTKDLDKLVFWMIIGGFIGARLFDVFLFEWPVFKDHLNFIPQIWLGGLSIHGGLVGGTLALWIWICYKKLLLLASSDGARQSYKSFLELADLFAPALALGQAIGRWGNYFNQEIFGGPTNLPWGIPIELANRPAGFEQFQYFHPVFLYESIALIIIFCLLWYLLVRRSLGAGGYKKNPRPGIIFAIYLIATGVVRFVLEFIRLDDQLAPLDIRIGWWLSALGLVMGMIILLWHKRSNSQNQNAT